MTKYLKLFEDFSKEEDKESFAPSWQDLRDTIQNRLPFAIIVFLNKDSYSKAKSKMFFNHTNVKQTAFLSKNGTLIGYPSVFIKLDDEPAFVESIPKMYEKYKIKAMVVAGQGDEYAKYYFADGSSTDLGNEIITSLSKDDMENDDHFQMNSNYYKFIDFVG